jgi:phosphomannomutase
MREAYFRDLASLCSTPWFRLYCSIKHVLTFILARDANRDSKIIFVNTPMHGVGHTFVAQAFDTFGFCAFKPVPAQKDPDPEFPTVRYPNPEEKG